MVRCVGPRDGDATRLSPLFYLVDDEAGGASVHVVHGSSYVRVVTMQLLVA